jgi:hypothetical protein
MKKPVLALLAAFVLIASCKKVQDKVKDVAQQATIVTKVIDDEQELAIPNYPPITFPPPGIRIELPPFGNPTYIGDFLKEYNTTTDRLISAKATKLGLKLLTPANGNLDYVDSLWIYVSAKGLPEQLVGYIYPVPKSSRDLPGTVVDKDMKEYFTKDTLYYKVAGHFTRYPDSNTKILLYSSFKVEASPVNTK